MGAAFSSLATCADAGPNRKERGRVRDAAADFTRASGEKTRGGGDFLLFTRSRQILRPLHVLFQTVIMGYVLAEVIHDFDDLLPKYWKTFCQIRLDRCRCGVKSKI